MAYLFSSIGGNASAALKTVLAPVKLHPPYSSVSVSYYIPHVHDKNFGPHIFNPKSIRGGRDGAISHVVGEAASKRLHSSFYPAFHAAAASRSRHETFADSDTDRTSFNQGYC